MKGTRLMARAISQFVTVALVVFENIKDLREDTIFSNGGWQ